MHKSRTNSQLWLFSWLYLKKYFSTSVKYAYPVDRFCLVLETDHVSNLKMVVFEMTSITVRRRDRVVPGFPSWKGNDFIGRYLIGLQTDLKIAELAIEQSLSPSD